MRVRNILCSIAMSLRELVRARLVLILAALVPPIFFAVAIASTGSGTIAVRLARAQTDRLFVVGERTQTLLFLGVAGVSLMGAFFGANLVQRRIEANRRLVLAGYRPLELVVAKLAVLLVIIAASSLYSLALLLLLVDVERPAGVLAGFLLAAFVYGAYGLFVGTVFRRDLETVFAILMLVNIDPGWLQNPIYYLNAKSPWLVESLPGHLPAQTALLAALTTHPLTATSLLAGCYGIFFLIIALAIYTTRMRVRPTAES